MDKLQSMKVFEFIDHLIWYATLAKDGLLPLRSA
jgi:hypothetical protein